MKKAVVFGAGNIGRGFIGQLFCESGYETTFVDVDDALVEAFNARGYYKLQTVFNEDARDYVVGPVKALHAVRQAAEVKKALSLADIAATSVGANALKHLVPNIAGGLELRAAMGGALAPLNIILCENLHGASSILRKMLRDALRPELQAWLETDVGLVDTVIGRMVPAPTPEMRSADVSFIRTEPYKELPVDKEAFKGSIPAIVAMQPYEGFEVFTARKLYLHNCGHAILAYLGYLKGCAETVDALKDASIEKSLRAALSESVDGIVAAHGAKREWLEAHLDDLMRRFSNRPLGDTVLRLGRDPWRKLRPDDRLVGAARLAEAAGVLPANLARAIAAAFLFNPADDPAAASLRRRVESEGLGPVMNALCGIAWDEPLGKLVIEAYARLSSERSLKKAVVAGHICLDVIPSVDHSFDMAPGRLFEVGAACMATGGAVSNTGVAMHILGQPVSLMGKIGDDSFGRAIQSILSKAGEGLAEGMIVSPGAVSSYSVVINIPGHDRTFLHCPGANHSFDSKDVTQERLAGASLLHFGYPPIMARTYADGGVELERIFKTAKSLGMTTSMDMVVPDPDGPSGKADWQAIFKRVLPLLDVFLPSIDELLYVLDRPNFGRGESLSPEEVSKLGAKLLDYGVAIAGVKLGSRGLYIRTASAARLERAGLAKPEDLGNWADRELWFPTYRIKSFAGATGAGDVTIGAFLCALLRGLSVEDSGRFANAVGACNVEAPDALGGLLDWDSTWRRLREPWPQNTLELASPGWSFDAPSGVWHGSSDSLSEAALKSEYAGGACPGGALQNG